MMHSESSAIVLATELYMIQLQFIKLKKIVYLLQFHLYIQFLYSAEIAFL